MANSKWTKAPAAHTAAFDVALPTHPTVERRSMLSYSCACVNGNLFCCPRESSFCVRSGSEAAAARIKAGQANVFSPMARRVMRECAAVPVEDCAKPARLNKWLADALAFPVSLPVEAKSPLAR